MKWKNIRKNVTFKEVKLAIKRLARKKRKRKIKKEKEFPEQVFERLNTLEEKIDRMDRWSNLLRKILIELGKKEDYKFIEDLLREPCFGNPSPPMATIMVDFDMKPDLSGKIKVMKKRKKK